MSSSFSRAILGWEVRRPGERKVVHRSGRRRQAPPCEVLLGSHNPHAVPLRRRVSQKRSAALGVSGRRRVLLGDSPEHIVRPLKLAGVVQLQRLSKQLVCRGAARPRFVSAARTRSPAHRAQRPRPVKARAAECLRRERERCRLRSWYRCRTAC